MMPCTPEVIHSFLTGRKALIEAGLDPRAASRYAQLQLRAQTAQTAQAVPSAPIETVDSQMELNEQTGLVRAPWTIEAVRQLNLCQRDLRTESYTCAICSTDLFATRAGWMCARRDCTYRQAWALATHTQATALPTQRRAT
jgi:hypothetical protein